MVRGHTTVTSMVQFHLRHVVPLSLSPFPVCLHTVHDPVKGEKAKIQIWNVEFISHLSNSDFNLNMLETKEGDHRSAMVHAHVESFYLLLFTVAIYNFYPKGGEIKFFF